MMEFPPLLDADIATLMRDELINNGQRDPAWFQWATVETVSRMRRTVIVEAEREKRLRQ